MDVTVCPNPVRHFVIDGFVEPRAWWDVAPASTAVCWEAQYDNDLERGKRTTRGVHGWSEDVVRKMHDVETLRACVRAFGVEAYPDGSLWGGGLQVIAPGGHLSTHLDGVLHPHRPHLRRAIQLVCFCSFSWEPDWGGRFYFADPGGDAVTWIDPLPGRLLAFESTDLSYHGVERVNGPAERVTVATSLLAPAREYDTRKRALFLPPR